MGNVWEKITHTEVKGVRVVSLVAVVVLFAAGAVVRGQLKKARVELGLEAEDSETRQSFVTSLGVALGGFRGIAADLLWLRAIRKQEEGEFHEIAALCETILALQPHYTQVWAYQAWNMAYNLTAQEVTEESRWRWVKKGIDLLAGEGIKRNPNSYYLYWELGFLYYHKVSLKGADPSSWYYRRQIDPDNPLKCFEMARGYFAEAEKKPDCPPLRASSMRIHCLEALGMWAEAENEWAKLMRSRPEKDASVPNAFRNFLIAATRHYAQRGDEKRARKWFARIAVHFPDDKITFEKAATRYDSRDRPPE